MPPAAGRCWREEEERTGEASRHGFRLGVGQATISPPWEPEWARPRFPVNVKRATFAQLISMRKKYLRNWGATTHESFLSFS